MGAAAVSAFLWLLSVPTAPDCQRLSSLSPDIDRLYCSQIAASSGNVDDLLSGLALMASWDETHPLYAEAQNWMEEWSSSILEIARDAVRQGDLERGRQLSQQIPASSPSYDDAVAALAQWDETWTWGEDLMQQAQEAIKASNWGEVTAIVQVLRRSEYRYWRLQQPQMLNEQVTLEKAAQRQRADVLRLARPGSLEALRQAIALAQQVDPDTYAWAQLQPSLNQWGNRLLDQGLKDWYATRLPEAIAGGSLVTDIPDLAIDAHDLMILSRARQRAMDSFTHWAPTVSHLWELNRAIATAKAITPGSRFYPQAAASIVSWERQLLDLSQLYQARLAADGQQISSYQAAISSAAVVEAGRMRRMQAQTLAAHWQQEIERIEDAPRLQAARQLAKPGAVEDLRSAIARAGQIESDRALYPEAQGAIAQWTNQIQTIEDQPILDRARRYASQGRLRQAVQEVSAVRGGRALSGEATALRRQWQARLNAAARPERPPSTSSPKAVTPTPEPAPPPVRQPKVQRPAATLPPQSVPPVLRPAPQDIVPPEPEASPSQPPLFNQSPASGLYPSEMPTRLTPAPPRFSNEFVDETGSVAEPVTGAPPPCWSRQRLPRLPPPAPPRAAPSPAAPAPVLERSALPELAPETGDALEPQSRALPSPQAAPALADAQLKASSIVAPPELVDLLPETASARFLGDSEAFPLLYAAPLFVM